MIPRSRATFTFGAQLENRRADDDLTGPPGAAFRIQLAAIHPECHDGLMAEPPASWASTEHARRTMRANRSRDTKPELAVRQELHRRGWRFRVAYRPLLQDRRRTVDIAFTRRKVAVHVDGCFWHGCAAHFVPPKTNPQYWADKIKRNQERDRDTDKLLRAAGWTVLRFWEHENSGDVAAAIEAALRRADETSDRL